MPIDQQTLVTLVVSVIVTILGLLYRYWKPLDPVKSWLEMGLAIAGSIVIAAVLGKLSPLPAGDPIKIVQYFLEMAAVVFGFVQLVYNLIQQAFPASALSVRVFKAK